MTEPDGLSLFHPLVARWFRERVGEPTDVQAQAWPRIAAGEHVLVTAPTGSGKTLTAFLWAVDRLVSGDWPVGHTTVLYVSPLKALNNDIRRNLLSPLAELREVFEEAGEVFPDIRVLTRSGDTPQSDRRRMLRQPPEILITTPESLNLLLSSVGGRSLLGGLSTVILDEIHAVVGSKRGTHLITAVDRLVPLSGDFQRLALSATVRPMETVADFVGGFQIVGPTESPEFQPRPVTILRSAAGKQYNVSVRFPKTAADPEDRDSVWEPLVEEFGHIIDRNQSTLLFVNSRRLCEKLTLQINEGSERLVAYAHHGSLSREIREEVEAKLKSGDLKAIVATSSLEMGIDIGALDEVVLIQSPPAISSGIQRVGRAGHRVGEVSRATLFPTHSHDFLEAAVLAEAICDQSIEAIHPVDGPLDVLAQVIISMVGVETWDLDGLFAQVRASYPYRELTREQFDLVLNMLAGRYADTRVRELSPRVSVDRLDHTVTARPGALQDLYMSGGTIPDRGYFNLRLQESNARLGELDEEFVWESSEGQSFTLGTQTWTIQKITHSDVFVVPAGPQAVDLPFWIGEPANRDFHFSERLGSFLEEADGRLDDELYPADLQRDHFMDETAAAELIAYLRRQREVTGRGLPHRHHVLVEFVESGPDGFPGDQVILHTFWGGRLNRPYAMALEAAWEQRFQQRLEVYPSNDCIILVLPCQADADEILALVTSANAESMLRQQLEASGFFGSRFRESAGRALLLTRTRHGRRMPLWMTRLRSQKLLDAVMRYEDFPILVEAWRTCLRDEFDLPALHHILSELEAGLTSWTQTRTEYPSPFAQGVAWRQINQYMYMGDEPAGGRTSSLRGDLLRDVVFTPGLRPGIPLDLAERFEQKRQRLWPGYAPRSGRDLVDWVIERRLIPQAEWDSLQEAMDRDAGDPEAEDPVAAAGDHLVRLSAPGLATPLIAALESTPLLLAALFPGQSTDGDWQVESPVTGRAVTIPSELGPDEDAQADELLQALLTEWLQFYGPMAPARIGEVLGLDAARLQVSLDELAEAETLISGQLIAQCDDELICDSQNFESLLRLARAAAVPAFEPLPLEQLSLFLARYHGLTGSDDEDDLARRLEQLLCYDAPASLWESEILPARLRAYATSGLDGLMQESVLRWVGRGRERVTFCFEPDLDLLDSPRSGSEAPPSAQAEPPGQLPTEAGSSAADQGMGRAGVAGLFPDPAGRYDFSTLRRLAGIGAPELCQQLWDGVWDGAVTNDTFTALRKGIETRFQVAALAAADGDSGGRGGWGAYPRRSAVARWREGALPFAGNWQLLPPAETGDDLLEQEERGKERVRLLLTRYGILFRELLLRESPAFRWAAVFRSLRLMELAGEVLAGRFFDDIPGPQFISHQAFRQLQRQRPDEAVYWVNAADPVSLCGLQLDAVRGTLPKRVPSTHLVYRGAEVVVTSLRHGRDLTFSLPPDDGDLPECLGLFRHLLTRALQPIRQIVVERINGEWASESPYLDALRIGFDARLDHHDVILLRRV